MIDISTARALVEKELAQQSLDQPPEDELVIVDILPIEDIGWIFLCNTRALAAAQHPDDETADNFPIIVDKKDGALRYVQTSSRLARKSMENQPTNGLIAG